MPSVEKHCRSRSTGSPFYSVELRTVYWEYEAISSVYNGFTFQDLTSMTVRQRDFWYRMAKWRGSRGG